MKKPVLQRKLFAKGGQVESEYQGILSGFEEDDDDYESEDRDDDNDMEEGYEERTPENLEIIANNLRGDIRSMDERYLELAQLVGDAAFETPEEVVALMQSQLAQQQPPTGIETLGAPSLPGGGILSGMEQPEQGGQGMPPQPGMMPEQGMGMPQPGMEQAGMQPPLQMADGGLVYRANGSGPFGEIPRGVTGRPLAGGNIPQMNLDAMRGARLMSEMQGSTPWYTQAGQQLYGAATNLGQRIKPFIKELPRVLRATPAGRAAAVGSTILGGGILGQALMGQRAEEEPQGGPIYSEVPGIDAQGRYQPVLQTLENMPGTPEERGSVREMGMDTSMVMPRLGAADLTAQGPTPADIIRQGTTMVPETPEEERRRIAMATADLEKPGAERERTYRDRVKEKIDLYSEFLGTDPEMRKAQALFAIAEAALNVATAKGRSVGENIALGTRGLPSALGTIGAEAERDRRTVAAAALQSVESEIAAEKKAAADLYKALLNKKDTKAGKYEGILAQRFPEMPADQRNLLAQELDLEVVKPLPTGELVDTLSGAIRYSPYKPVGQGNVGYMDPANPFVVDTGTTVAPATIDDRKTLINRRSDLQKSIAQNEKMLADIYGDTIGFLPTIGSGVSRMTLATFGDVGFGLTDVAKNQIRQNLALNRENILKNNLRNSGRPSVYDQQKIEKLIDDPNALFASPELIVSSVQNFVREDMNELARIDSQLFGVPIKEMQRVPTGSKSDPIRLGPNISLVLDQVFEKRPNASIWTVRPDGSTARITAPEYFAQRRGPAQ
jgi:hypothetical protein